MEYFGNGSNYDLDIAYLFQDNYQGMPYALDLAKPWLRADETVLFGMPDTIISPVNIFCELVRHHSDNLCDLTLGAFSTEKPQKFCMVDFDKSRVISVIDKPERTYLKYMWGVACWSENFIESMHKFLSSHKKEKEEVLFSDVIQDAILSGLKVEIKIFDDGNYLDIGTLEDLKSAIINYSQKP